ncbi:hypothetical protein HDF26_004700 [Pedobacter cryoconitis]|nr:hypothetical protein [Pedobacter cryoconitis]
MIHGLKDVVVRNNFIMLTYNIPAEGTNYMTC